VEIPELVGMVAILETAEGGYYLAIGSRTTELSLGKDAEKDLVARRNSSKA